MKTKYVHIWKTVTWRLVGTTDTMLIGYLVTGKLTTGLSIGVIEFVTKTVLYWLHEKAWYYRTKK